ncbi:MAG: zinc ribbon domain-containing protein [Anaerolineae bacterium]|nr:zinc ribbon domain-containing protein [Anaerolineae bacterium]
MIQCPACGAQNADYARECAFCGTDLERPALTGAAADLRDQLLGMSLGAEDFNTICFALNVDWHRFYDLADEAGKIEILVRQLQDEGRLDEVARFLRDFRFPTSYPPLPQPPADNFYLTYVYACQNVERFDQLQRLAEQVGISDASQLPGLALPHKIREVLWAARRANALPQVHDWLRTLRPEEQLTRPRIRERRSRVRRPGNTGPGSERGRSSR